MFRISIFFFLSWFLLVSFTGCKKKQPTSSYSIVGNWTLEKLYILGLEQNLSNCNKQSYMKFEPNHRAESKFYKKNAGNCEVDMRYKGTWFVEDNKTFIHVEKVNGNPADYNREVYFIDENHYYVYETSAGIEGKFIYKKQN